MQNYRYADYQVYQKQTSSQETERSPIRFTFGPALNHQLASEDMSMKNKEISEKTAV